MQQRFNALIYTVHFLIAKNKIKITLPDTIAGGTFQGTVKIGSYQLWVTAAAADLGGITYAAKCSQCDQSRVRVH